MLGENQVWLETGIMAAKNRNRVLLQLNGTIKKFFSFSQDEKDGSLYITFTRAGDTESTSYSYLKDLETDLQYLDEDLSSKPKRFQVHYHTTGRIHFKDPVMLPIYGEPITRITEPFWFGSLISPAFDSLDNHNEPLRSTDFVLPVEGELSKHRQFDLCISPCGQHLTSYGKARAHFTYSNFYTLNVIEKEEPIISLKTRKQFSFVAPRSGLFESQQITQENAHIEFQQKSLGHNGPIIHGPNRNYEYRVIFPIAATIPPKVNAILPNDTWELDVLDVRKSQARYRVVNSNDEVIKTPVEFSQVKLGDCEITLCT